MFALNIMRKTRYDEVTAYCWTGSTDEFRGNIVSFAHFRKIHPWSLSNSRRSPRHSVFFLIIFSANIPSRLCRETKYTVEPLYNEQVDQMFFVLYYAYMEVHLA